MAQNLVDIFVTEYVWVLYCINIWIRALYGMKILVLTHAGKFCKRRIISISSGALSVYPFVESARFFSLSPSILSPPFFYLFGANKFFKPVKTSPFSITLRYPLRRIETGPSHTDKHTDGQTQAVGGAACLNKRWDLDAVFCGQSLQVISKEMEPS